MRYLISTFVFIMLFTGQVKSATAKDFILESPDKKLKARGTINGNLSYSLAYMGKVYLLPFFPLNSKIGEYVCVARKKDKTWFMGAMTNWNPRTLTVNFDFLDPDQSYQAEVFMDGPNAERVGSDYSRVTKTVKKGDEIKLEMAAGGGWSARFSLTNK